MNSMVEIKIPTVLRKHVGGEAVVTAEGGVLKDILETLSQRFPGLSTELFGDDGELHRFVNLYLNDEDVRYLDGLNSKVADGDVVSILPAVAGG